MSEFIISIWQVFLPIFILLPFLWVKTNKRKLKPLLLLVLASMFLGAVLAQYLVMNKVGQIWLISSLFVAWMLLLLNWLLSWRTLTWSAHFLLALSSAWFWDWHNQPLIITVTSVLDTELIYSLAALVFALLCLSLLAIVLFYIIKQAPPWRYWPVSIILLLNLYPLSGEILLLLAKEGYFDLSSNLLSYVAKATNFPSYTTYISIALLLVYSCIYCFTVVKSKKQYCKIEQSIIKRKAIAQYQYSRRLYLSNTILLAAGFAVQLYWDKIGSQPMALSKSTRLYADEDGMLRIAVEQVRDGDLHRFIWVASDGHVIRFFVINKQPERLRLATVFDACMLCGDQGYVMQGNQLVCIACKVHLFIPSVGKASGCNPLLIEEGGWSYDENTVSVKTQALANGAQFFSTVLTISVIDPVNGAELTNKSAEYSYIYEGVSYFFASQANYENFRQHPEQYLPNKGAQ